MAIPLMQQIEGKYEILEKMGEGGMGAVYKVRHRVLEEVRVIKVMRPQLATDEKLRVRFLREAKTAIRLRHPNVAQLYDCTVDDDGNAYMVMEFIEGVTFEQILQQMGPPPTGLALEMAAQSLKALASLHRKKVIHRDIAPDNLMLSRSEEDEPLVKLIDLGIAKTLEADIHLTATGMFVGKLRYSSPEHFQRQEGVPIDSRSDLYSFGVVLYELLTGRHPISGTSMSALIAGHLFHPPRSFAETDPEGRVPDELRRIVLKALSKGADDRYQSASEFRQALITVQKDFTLTENDLARALALMPPPTIRFPVIRRGKTQEELDRQFAPLPTPPPEAVTSATPPPIPGSSTLEEAEAEAAAAERDSAIAEAAGAVAALVAAGKLDRAGSELDAAVARFGDVEPLQEAKDNLSSQIAARRNREMRVKTLADEARRQLARGAFNAARQHLDRAASIDPTSSVVVAVRDELEAALRAQEAERQREQQLASAVEEIGALLDSGTLAKAREELEKAEKRFGGEKALEELRSGLSNAEEKERRQRVAALREEAAGLLNAGQPRAAVTVLERALGLDLSDQETARQLAAARQQLRAEEAHQELEKAVGAVARAVETHLAKGHLDAAWRELEAAPAAAADSSELADLRSKVGAEIAARRERQAKVEGSLDEARRRIAANELDQALRHLREAGRLDPTNQAVQSLTRETEEAIRRREEERRREQLLAEASGRIRRHLQGGDLERAGKDLEKAEQALGPAPLLQDLRTDLEAAGRRAIQARLDELAQQARELAAANRFKDAVVKLEEASALAPSDQAVAQLLAETKEAQRHHVEQQRQQQRVAKAKAEIERLLAAGKVQKAARRLAAAHKQLEPAAELRALERQVKQAEAAPRVAPARHGRRYLLPLAAAAVVMAIVLTVVLLRSTREEAAAGAGARAVPSVQTCTLVVDAVPWAKITNITNADGKAQPLPKDAVTPVVLTLPPGTYTLALTHPDRPQPHSVTVTLAEGKTVHEVARLSQVDLDTFFKQMGW